MDDPTPPTLPQDTAEAPTDLVAHYLTQLPIRYPWTDQGPHRPSLLTKATATRITNALIAGHTRKTAAQLAGINPVNIANWMLKGDTDDESPDARPYIAFRCAVLTAEAQAEDTAIRGVRAAGEKDWKAWGWWLSRARHQEWAERSREGESGRSGVTVNVGIALAPGQPSQEPQSQVVETTWVSVPSLDE